MNYKTQKWQIFGKRLNVPKYIRKRVYEHSLTFKEYVEYGLDIDSKVPIECIEPNDRKIVERFGVQKCKDLDWELLDFDIYLKDINIRDVLLTISPDVEDINQKLYELIVDSISPENYSSRMKKIYTDRFMEPNDYENDYDKNMAYRFNEGRLGLDQIIKNWELFKDKNLSLCLSRDYRNTAHITNDVLKEFVSSYESLIPLVIERGNIYTFISEIMNLEPEERLNYIKTFTDNLLNDKDNSLTNDEYREIFKYSSMRDYFVEINSDRDLDRLFEELEGLPEDYIYNIPFPISVLVNYHVLRFINEYGLKNIVDFDNECGQFFSKNDCEMLKLTYNMYLHYHHGIEGSSLSIRTSTIDENGNYIDFPYTKDQFYEVMRRMILFGPTDGTMRDKAPDYRSMEGEFRTRNQDLFISEDAPEELQKLFYTKAITPGFITEHPEYIEYLRGKYLSSCFVHKEIGIYNEAGYKDYVLFYKYLDEKFGFDETMKLIAEYGDILDIIHDWNIIQKYNLDFAFHGDDDISEFRKKFNELFVKVFVKENIDFPRSIPQGLKDNYPMYFLPDTAPEEIRNKFYKRELTVQDFENSKIIDYFDKTNIVYGFPSDYFWMRPLFENTKNMKLANLNRLKIMISYSKIQDIELQNTFKEYIVSAGDDIEKIDFDNLDFIATVLSKLSLSNSSEIYAFRKELATQILNSDNPLETLSKIEDLFIRNNIPTVGKIYSCFEILHPDFKGFNFENSMISPVLKKSSRVSKKVVVFSDLIKATFGSNNRSVNAYLNNIEFGSKLYERIRTGELNYDALSEIEKRELILFSKHLITLYNNTLIAKRSNNFYDSTGDVIKDILEVAKRISPNETLDYNIGDRIIKMFCGFSGIETLEQAKAYIRQKVSIADKRNREAGTHDMVLKQGDYIKGIGKITYLRNILQNGSVAKEFLGPSAGSDATPLDTDLSKVLISGSTSEMLDSVEAKGYGPIWFVLKNNDRFVTTRTIDGDLDVPRDLSKLEIFYTGAVGKGHYGIRTGFASSEIDYIVMESYDPRVGLEIAINGFYIPVANKEGKIIFTPHDYDMLRAKMSGLSYYGENEYQYSESLVTPETELIASQIEQSNYETNMKRSKINEIIQKALEEVGLNLKTSIDGDLTPGYVELIDTGSTGRGTNKPGDGDFDFMMRLDRAIMSNPAKLDALKRTLLRNFGKSGAGEITGTGDFRLKGVQIDEKTVVDIDITFTEKTDKVTYSTDMALQDRLLTIKRNDPERYNYVVANILLAKKVLKAAGVYKPNRGDTPQGGLGGVGIENWILQNGGSFIDAAISFLEASQGRSFEEFKQVYRIWDFGENHLAERRGQYSHDNFVTGNMSEEGYKKMCEVLTNYLKLSYQGEDRHSVSM